MIKSIFRAFTSAAAMAAGFLVGAEVVEQIKKPSVRAKIKNVFRNIKDNFTKKTES